MDKLEAPTLQRKKTISKTYTDKEGKQVEYMISEEEERMHKKADEQDKIKEEESKLFH